MAINLATKFSDKVAERFTLRSLTDAYAGKGYDFSGVKSIKGNTAQKTVCRKCHCVVK